MNLMQESATIKAILTAAKTVLELLGEDHPLNQTLLGDLNNLIARLDGPFPIGG